MMLGLGRIGRSPAAQRINAAGYAFQRKRRIEHINHERAREALEARLAVEAARRNREQERETLEASADAVFGPRCIISMEHRPDIIRKIAQVQQDACAAFGISIEGLWSLRRPKRLVVARHYVMQRLVDETPMSLPQIGRAAGGRDHTTVLYACRPRNRRRVGEWLEKPRNNRGDIDGISAGS